MFKIVHITTVDLSLRYLLLNQLRFLQQQGFEVSTISSSGENVPVITQFGIRHIPVQISRSLFSPLRDIISFFRLFKILKEEQFDIVHTHTPKASFLGQMAAKLAGVPIIIRTLHGFYIRENMHPFLRRMIILLEKIAGRSTDFILSQNREDIVTALEEGITQEERIEYLGNGIDLAVFDPATISKKDKERKRKELGLIPNKPVVGFVGRLVAEKGLIELFQAAKNINEEIGQIQFLFVGPVDDDHKDAVTQQAASEYGVAEICKFVGFQEDMPVIYSLMDVFVLPSHREGFPRSLMEASAMQIPCIATDIRGCREVVFDGENGLLVPLKDVQALSEAIRRILSNQEQASKMGQVGNKIAQDCFNEKVVFERVVQAYHSLLSKKGLPPLEMDD